MIVSILRDYDIPGASLAVGYRGRLVFSKGYGLSDREAGTEVNPASLFRIASISKPFTGLAVMHLVETGRLSLDEPAFALLENLERTFGTGPDPRLDSITIRHLLQHSGGWDRNTTFEPMFNPFISTSAAELAGHSPPGSCRDIVRYMKGRPLQFQPGSQMVYANFGYCVLQMVIEEVSGVGYEQYVRSLLASMGIHGMRVGRTLPSQRYFGEVHYYDHPSAALSASIFPGVEGPVARPDGAFAVEAKAAEGGWVASAPDLVRFAQHFNGQRDPAPLSDPTVEEMLSRPSFPTSPGYYYGLSWEVQPSSGGRNWSHSGSMPGTSSLLFNSPSGLTFAVIFNSAPANHTQFWNDFPSRLSTAFATVEEWPDNDRFGESHLTLFPQFASSESISSTVVLVNPDATVPALGTVRPRDPEGQEITALMEGLPFEGGYSFEIAPGGTAFLQLSTESDELLQGWIEVASDRPLNGTIIFGGSFGLAGVPAAVPTQRFRVPVQVRTQQNLNTGVAIANPDSQPAVLAVTLADEEGSPVQGGQKEVTVPPRGRLSLFVTELFPEISLQEFRGSIMAEGDQPVTVIGLLTTANQFATLPVTRLDQ
ncbi:MAG TPA: DUF5719 family protein [Acidobacteriota bacterium]|nr:DUF5719 family protein [Acidobacteriota bacterium]